MRLHAIVSDLETAEVAVAGGATVVQLRLKGVGTADRVALGLIIRRLPATFVMNDDVEAALRSGADGVHLGPDDDGAGRARDGGLLLGRSVSTVKEARAAERDGAGYLGVGPIWATPSKADAGEPIGLRRLAGVCSAVSIPVVAIGGIGPLNAARCLQAGAQGVAVVRGARRAAELRAAMDAAGALP